MKLPIITTIIPTCQRPQLLKKALQSVLAQTYPHFQVWICDNNSRDETAKIAQDWAQKDSRVKYHCHEKNIGMMRNYQFGLSLVDTDYFSFLSDDDTLLPHFYETALQGFYDHPDAGFVAGSTVIVNQEGHPLRIPLSFWKREGRFTSPEGVLEMIGKYPVPTSILFHKKIYAALKIDEDNPLVWDCDYLLQAATLFPFVISKKPCAFFLYHRDSYSNHLSLESQEEAFKKLGDNLNKNPHLSLETKRSAQLLLEDDLNRARKGHFLQHLLAKEFAIACQIAKKLGTYPSYKYRSLLYYSLAKTSQLFPLLTNGIKLLRRLQLWIRCERLKRFRNFNLK